MAKYEKRIPKREWRKAHLPADEHETLCKRDRVGIEVLVGPPRMQLRQFICTRCWAKYGGPIGPNLEPGKFQTMTETSPPQPQPGHKRGQGEGGEV